MKKILHLFSDPSHSALWSRYLRMITMIALLAFGSLGGWGEELSGNLGAPASSSGQWDSGSHKYTWTESYSNLMDLFSGIDLTDKLGKDYAAIVFTTSGYNKDQEYRIVFGNDVNDNIATIVFYSDGTNKQVVFAKHENTKDIDLSKVKYIKFGGNTGSGSITLDPSSIKLVGHKVTFSAAQSDKGTVTATYYGKPFQSGNAVAPGTELTLTATPTEGNLFWTWRQKIGDNYIPEWEGSYNAPFKGGATPPEATINQALDMQADFSSIWVKAIQQESDKEYGSVKILHNELDKGTEYHITPWPGNIKFVAEDGPKGFFIGWYKDASYITPAADVNNDKGEIIYKNTDKTYCPSIGGQDVNLYAKFEPGVQVNANVEPSFLSPTIKIHQQNEPDWVINNGQYVKKYTTAVFNVEDIDGYTFKGWYQGETQITAEKTWDYGNVYADVTLTAKFECNIANNTQIVDLTKISTPSNPSNNVTAVSWDKDKKELSVKTINTTNNVLYLKTFQNGENRGTGIRIHAKGDKYRLIVRLNNDNDSTKVIKIDEATGDNYVTRHRSWKDFELTDEQINRITDVGVAGNNDDATTENTFYVKYFWIDDIADYDHTIACYGEENGNYNHGTTVYTYSRDNDGVKAAFSGIIGGDRDDETNSMKFKGENTLNISSANYNFSSIGLVFDTPCNYSLTVGEKSVSGNGTAVVVPVSGSSINIVNKGNSALILAKITYTGNSTGLSEECTITVDGMTRKYWIYAPGSVNGNQNVPVIFSLHGRQDKGADPDKTDAPKFKDIADTKGVIIVYPQGRNGNDQGYPNRTENGKEVAWNSGYAGNNYGWEATGQENADTKFIQALVDELKKNKFYNNTTVDPKRFYLCGFSMGGMMTYACAKVLNGTFAAYGSCGGYPLNEFHLNLATKQPVPFMHLHGDADGVVGINHLHTIIENLLFRNGCKLSQQQNNDDGWTTTTVNDMKRYDFKGVNGVPVTTVTFKNLEHWVHSSAPAYLWDFFSDKTVGKYDDTDIEWKWDMPTINAEIAKSSSGDVNAFTYGWKHVINGNDRSLKYGGEGNTKCSLSTGCSSDNPNCTGNHNVYNSIQLTAGKHTLYAQMKSTSGESTVTLRNILTGAETVARKVVDNSGTQAATDYNVLYEFEVGEGAEFSLELTRSNTNSACTLLEIHKGSYRPEGVKDQSEDNASINLENGKLAELTFEKDENYGVDITPITEKSTENGVDKYNVNNSSDNGNMKLYLISRLGIIKNGEIENKAKYIVKDTVFGHYFQNIPDADIYDRYGASDYMRVVLGTNNSLSGHDGIKGIQETGKVTIGFWVNGDLAVNRGLAYDEPSMFYIAGNTYNGPNEVNNPHMFNITCSGGLTGYMNDTFKYNSGTSSFGGLCDTKSNADFYNKNFYKDCNWHYITYQMYDNLSRYNMYVDGEPTCLGGYAMNNARSLNDCISGLKSIVLGGANANNVTFAYDVAFAYDDIVIYNRVLSKREINKIIENKKYSPSVWNFDQNLESDIFFNKDNLNNTMWTSSSDGVYTLNTNFTQAAALTYDGITEIPAFKGLRFVTNGNQKIQIDAKSGALHLSKGVKVVFSNLVKDTYVRMEYKKNDNVKFNDSHLQNMSIFGSIPSTSQGCYRQLFKVGDKTSGENSITMPSDIDIIRMEATAKSFAQLMFVDRTNHNNVVSVVTNPSDTLALPRMDLKVNNNERLHQHIDNTKYNFKYTSSSPHVASIDSISGKVTLHGIAGSTVITAELINDENKYDCDIYDQYAFEPSNRIFSSYEIVVEPKPGTFCKVVDGKTYTVGQTLYNNNNDDKTVGVTLGGWTYNDGIYYGNTDSYSEKEPWEGHKFEKNADRNGYLENSRKTEEDVFHEFFNDAKATFSTNGSFAAKSEQLNVDDNNTDATYAATGNYSAPTENKSVANVTPWLLPCRGSYIKIEPIDAGLISVYVMQEGCVSHDNAGEPNDVTVKRVYVADEKGEIVKEVVADTKSKVAAQMWKDDGRARAEYFWDNPDLAYNEATMKSFLKINDFNTQWSFLDNWPNPGMQQHVFKVGKDEDGKDKDGYVLITKGIVRYTFNVLPGKTYYIFSNTAKLGLAGFTFEKGKHAEYDMVQVDAKHKECRATGVFDDVSKVQNVQLVDGKNYSAPTDAKNAEVTLNRTFYKNRWNAICLPYSINRRQIENQFGDGTMVVLMKNIDTSNKKVMFIEHANQDIIAGYPYLIFPTIKADTEKKDTTAINGITTRATFGEANSPLFSVGTDGTTCTDGKMQPNTLVFKGTFSKADLPVGSYVITKSGTLANVSQTGLWINPYRAYIHFNQTTPGAKAIKLASMGFAGIDDMEGETTSIEDLLFNDGIMTRPADVFNVNGQKVRSKAENLYGLPKGVYIVNGKKYVNK